MIPQMPDDWTIRLMADAVRPESSSSPTFEAQCKAQLDAWTKELGDDPNRYPSYKGQAENIISLRAKSR
mgnify:CR=1 FL=1